MVTQDPNTGQPSLTLDEITFWSVTGQKLATYPLSGDPNRTYIWGQAEGAPTPAVTASLGTSNYYFGGKLIKNNTGYVSTDRLGSAGSAYYPYGQEKPSATQNGTEKFTGYFRDSETGLDYAVNRYHQPGMGRFLTADPKLSSAHLRGPGTWNRYSYAGGDPVNRIDPSGLTYFGTGDDCDVSEDPYECELVEQENDGRGVGGGGGGAGGIFCPSGQYFDTNTDSCELNPGTVTSTVTFPTVCSIGQTVDANGDCVYSIINFLSNFSLVPNLSLTVPIPRLLGPESPPTLGVQVDFTYIPTTQQPCVSIGLAFSPTGAGGVGLAFLLDPADAAPNIIPGPSAGITLQQNPLSGVTATGSLGQPVIAGPSFGTTGASINAGAGTCFP
jgi:RHS repeat-associated protein